MRHIDSLDKALLATVLLTSASLFYGCNSATHPDDKDAVYQSLDHSKLYSVVVSQDRDKGVITLKGIVGSDDSKTQAQQLAQKAAPGYTVDNQIRVDNAGLSDLAKPGTSPEKAEKAKPTRR